MATIHDARKIVQDAEAALNGLIAKALEEHRYDDVKEIADLAKIISLVLAGKEIQFSNPPPPISINSRIAGYGVETLKSAGDKHKKTVKRSRSVSKAKAGYPKFVRDQNRLVKVGWSKKNKKEYEHRVPREAVFSFVKHLNSKAEEGAIFEIDSLFPVVVSAGEEIPGYQVYVIVAWLREVNLIEKKGRDGYVLRDKSVLNGEINEKWNQLQSRPT